jgi:DNA-binding response OmpR family regulator
VLIVDADDGSRERLADILSPNGYDVRVAWDAASAIEQAGERPDVVLLDPAVLGIERSGTADWPGQRAEWRGVPIIFLTAGESPPEFADASLSPPRVLRKNASSREEILAEIERS